MVEMIVQVFFVVVIVENIFIVLVVVIYDDGKGGQVVWVVDSNGKLQSCQIRIGISDCLWVQVFVGLEEGDCLLMVVFDGSDS